MQIDNAEIINLLVLASRPAPHCAKVITEMKFTRRLDATQDTLLAVIMFSDMQNTILIKIISAVLRVNHASRDLSFPRDR